VGEGNVGEEDCWNEGLRSMTYANSTLSHHQLTFPFREYLVHCEDEDDVH